MSTLRSVSHLTQYNDFSNLQYGNMAPTDIDGLFEINNRLFVFIELKYGNALPPIGQRLALERVCDAIQSDTKHCFVLIAQHQDEGAIDVSAAKVVYYRHHKKWHTPKRCETVREALDILIDTYGYDRTTP